ncbi:MAG TPA: hypothetical protein VGR06_34465 [Actinophytocola sp.]|jgi:hypothetical protein|nr:hypothetical protein [Actinophytocola sp.]
MPDPVFCTGCPSCPEGNKHETCTCPLGADCQCEQEGCQPSS